MKKREVIGLLVLVAAMVAILCFTRPAMPPVKIGIHKSWALAELGKGAKPGSRSTLLINDSEDGFYALSTDYVIGRWQLCVAWDSDMRIKKVWRRWRWRWTKDL